MSKPLTTEQTARRAAILRHLADEFPNATIRSTHTRGHTHHVHFTHDGRPHVACWYKSSERTAVQPDHGRWGGTDHVPEQLHDAEERESSMLTDALADIA